MGFRCFFTAPSQASGKNKISDEFRDRDAPDVVIMGACRMLARTDASFVISGFGLQNWNLDISYDFSIFLEQLSDAVRELRAGNEFEITMYSQGIERVLSFEAQDGVVKIECISGTSWKPEPAVEELPVNELLSMLERLAFEFSKAVILMDESSAQLEPISSWVHRIY